MDARRKKRTNFTNAEKFRLIQLIRESSVLWDREDQHHYDLPRLQAAWKTVAEDLEKPVTSCKEAWVSLRESYRYHRKRDRDIAQQDDGDDYDPLKTTNKIQWQFAEAMSFLQHTAPKRPRSASPTVVYEGNANDDNIEVEVDEWMTESANIPDDAPLTPGSAKYIKENSKPKFESSSSPKCPKSSSKASVVDILSNFLNETRHCLEQPVSKNASVLAYWDTLLNGMSPQNSQRATFKITEYLQEIAKKDKGGKIMH